MQELETLQYPIGRFAAPDLITLKKVREWIREIEVLPDQLRTTVADLTEKQLDTPYRPGGWTVRQVIHHLPDSHLNSFIRFKWALTEERPTIKTYFEERWAELPDYRATPIAVSLDLLEALHRRWCVLLRSLGPVDLQRQFLHPESGPTALSLTIGTYAWHGRHHHTQIQTLIRRRDW